MTTPLIGRLGRFAISRSRHIRLRSAHGIAVLLSIFLTGESCGPLSQLNDRIAAYPGGTPGKTTAASRTATPAAKVRRAKRAARGSLQAEILSLIQASGENGIKVTELARKLGLSTGRLYNGLTARAARRRKSGRLALPVRPWHVQPRFDRRPHRGHRSRPSR